MKNIATLDLSPDLFVEFCKACKTGPPHRFEVIQNPLPDDTEVVDVEVSAESPFYLRLVLASTEFPEGKPALPLVILRTVYD